MTHDLASAYCWTILVSAAITTSVAIFGLVSKHYHETLPENFALCVVALAGAIVVLQIHARGTAQASGIALLSAAFALYAVARLVKGLADHGGGR